jgi:uncharacterized membrane protein YqiK
MQNSSKIFSIIKWIGSLFLLLILGMLFVGITRINTGHIGLRESLTGGNKGVSSIEHVSGWQFYLKTNVRIHELSIRQQPAEYEPFTIPAKGGTPLTVHPAFNYSLVPGSAAAALQKIGANVHSPKDSYIKTALRAALREATNKFTLDSIINNVGIFDVAVQDELNKRLAPYFVVEQFTTGIEPDASLKQAIAAKAQAVQEALRIQSEQAAIKAQVENDLLSASRDSAVKVKAAQAEARSIQLQQEALQRSPQYVELIKAQKWDGKLPQYMLGSSNGMFLNLNNK